MKVIFLFDNNECVAVEPNVLQLRQIEPGTAGLGVSVNIPVQGEDGKPKTKEDGTPELQQVFRPFINYNVDLSIPKPKEEAPAPAPQPAAPVAEAPAPAAPVRAVPKGKAAKKAKKGR